MNIIKLFILKGNDPMKRKTIKLQRRPSITAITVPKSMISKIGDDVTHLEIKQYGDGKITLTPLHGVNEK